MKIIGVCGSPRKGNTEFLLRTALDHAKKFGVNTELVLLREKNIEFCRGCEEFCSKTHECVINDDMKEVYEKLIESDALIIGTPTYFDMTSGILKNFIDRTCPLYPDKLKNKPLGIIAVGGGGPESIKGAIENIKVFSGIMGLKIIDKPVCVTASGADDVKKDEKALKLAEKLAEKIIESLK